MAGTVAAGRREPGLLLFAGAHRGFAPPRTEDVIDNASGATVALDAELSGSYEAAFRGRTGPPNVEVTARMLAGHGARSLRNRADFGILRVARRSFYTAAVRTFHDPLDASTC